jgi:hypothetical protein
LASDETLRILFESPSDACKKRIKELFPEPRKPMTRMLKGVGSRRRRRMRGDREAAVDVTEWRLGLR